MSDVLGDLKSIESGESEACKFAAPGWTSFLPQSIYSEGSWLCFVDWEVHARRDVCMAVEIPLLAKFGYEATEESVHQHSAVAADQPDAVFT